MRFNVLLALGYEDINGGQRLIQFFPSRQNAEDSQRGWRVCPLAGAAGIPRRCSATRHRRLASDSPSPEGPLDPLRQQLRHIALIIPAHGHGSLE